MVEKPNIFSDQGLLVPNRPSFLGRVNNLLLFSICAWISYPYLFYKIGHYGGSLLVFMWFLTTDYRWFTKRLSPDLFFMAIFYLTFIPYLLSGSFHYAEYQPFEIVGAIFMFFIGIFINHYYLFYKKDFLTLRRFALLSIFFYTIGSFQTFLGLISFPMASRHLARYTPMNELYESLGIGGYGFIFSSVFIVLGLQYLVLKKLPSRRISLKAFVSFSLFTITITILKASYATAIIILILGSFIIFLFRKRNPFFILIICLIILIPAFAQGIIGKSLKLSGDLLHENITLQQKAYELSNFFSQTGEIPQIESRFDKYLSSISTFLVNPIFGVNGPLGKPGPIGEHSGWFDVLAYFGLFTVIPMFIGIIYNLKKNFLFFRKSAYRPYFLSVGIIFLLLGFLKSTIYVYQIGFAMFLIVPSIPFCCLPSKEHFSSPSDPARSAK